MRSGAVTIAVPLHKPIEAEPTFTLWPSLDGATLADLGAVFALQSARAAR